MYYQWIIYEQVVRGSNTPAQCDDYRRMAYHNDNYDEDAIIKHGACFPVF